MTIARVLTTRPPASGVCSVRCRKRIERFSASTSIGTSHYRRCDLPSRMPPAIDRRRWLDFNNLPETRFEDVKQVLRVATERVGTRLNRTKQQGHLPANKRLQPSGR